MIIPIDLRAVRASLRQYIRENSAKESSYYLIQPLFDHDKIHQRGETCKLVALANAIDYVADKNGVVSPPLYKNKKNNQNSLRWFAKQNGSVVGEMYSIESLRKTCLDAGFTSIVCKAKHENDYIRALMIFIRSNQAPLVFFDLDMRSSEGNFLHPYIGDGNNEHAAVVVGYYLNSSGETHFIVMQYNRFFDFGGMELALSSLHSLSERRNPETFRKIRDVRGTTSWILESKICEGDQLVEGAPLRVAPTMADSDTPLKGIIMVVNGVVKEKKHATGFPHRFHDQSRESEKENGLSTWKDNVNGFG